MALRWLGISLALIGVMRCAAQNEDAFRLSKEIQEQFPGLAVAVLSTDSNNLFHPDSGIYCPGVHFNPDSPAWTGNYFQRGRDWERQAHFQFFDSSGILIIDQPVGIRIHGGKGRGYEQKSFRIYAREEYGAGPISYPIFDTVDTTFDRIVLRNSMSCWQNSVIREEVTNYVCRNLDVDLPRSKPCVLYLNDEFWGIYLLHDYLDEHHLGIKYDLPQDSINIVTHGSGNRPNQPADWGVSEGSNAGHRRLYDYLHTTDISDSANYAAVTLMLDIPSVIDYYCAEIFFCNMDWPSNNNKLWSACDTCVWRQLFFDMDAGWAYNGVKFNILRRIMSPNNTGKAPRYTTFLFMTLLESPEFKEQFLTRMAQLMREDFSPEAIEAAVTRSKELHLPAMQAHIDRWGVPKSMYYWNYVTEGMKFFGEKRQPHVIDHIREMIDEGFSLEGYRSE